MFATGPVQQYRFDLMKNAFPDTLREMVIIFTTSYYYKLYKDYHDMCTFINIDDYRNNSSISLEYELFLEVATEPEYWDGISNFCNNHKWPYDIQRFTFLYLLEKDIKNFAIIDTDVILSNDVQQHKCFFKSLRSPCFYAAHLGHHKDKNAINFLLNNISDDFINVDFSKEYTQQLDGWIRGFNFLNKSDMLLFFNIWEKAIVISYRLSIGSITGGALITDNNFLNALIKGVFVNQFNYNIKHAYELCNKSYNISGKTLLHHQNKIEDNLIFARGDGFDFSGERSIRSFIKTNKAKLLEYYSGAYNIRMTEDHIYLTLK
jgi:hypothetical protein